MKKLAGIVPPTFVRADEGKNGERGPAPSACMFSGGVEGLTIVYCAAHCRLIVALTRTGRITAAQSSRTPEVARRRAVRDVVRAVTRSSHAAANSTDSAASAACAYRTRWLARDAPR